MIAHKYILAACFVLLMVAGAQAQDPVHLWSMDFGNNEFQYAYDVAVDDSNNVVVVGGFYGEINFGCVVLERTVSTNAFVAKFDENGGCLWAKQFGDAARQAATHVATDRLGNIIVAGSFEGTVDFGGGELSSSGGFNMVLAKLDAQGNHVWSRRFGDADQLTLGEIKGIAVGDSSDIVITGAFAGTLDFGGAVLTSAGGLDMFLAKLDGDGNHQWSQSYGAAAQQYPRGVAIDGQGNVVATGDFNGQVDFGGGTLVNTSASDVFVAKFDSSGNHLWSSRYGNANAGDYHRAQGVAVDGAGNIVITGDYEGDIDFGGGVLAGAGEYDVFVAKLAPSGAHMWSQGFGDEDEDYVKGIAVDDSANVVVTGHFYGDIEFGGGPISSGGSNDIFLAKLDPDGVHLWSRGFGGSAYEFARGVAAGGAGSIVVAGFFYGTVDFGGGPLTSGTSIWDNTDIFTAKFGRLTSDLSRSP
jgi:hypothetical protein